MNCIAGPHDSIQQQRERWDRNRSITARELVQTEQLYHHQLQLVITVSSLGLRGLRVLFRTKRG